MVYRKKISLVWASTFKTRMDKCVKRNISIPTKIIKKIIENLKKKINKTMINNYEKAIQKTEMVLFGITNNPVSHKSSRSNIREVDYIKSILEDLTGLKLFLDNYLSLEVSINQLNIIKIVNDVLFYNFLNIMTTSDDYFETKGLNIFRTHFGGSCKTRKKLTIKL